MIYPDATEKLASTFECENCQMRFTFLNEKFVLYGQCPKCAKVRPALGWSFGPEMLLQAGFDATIETLREGILAQNVATDDVEHGGHIRKCKVCGCTETAPCSDEHGRICYLVKDNLCSQCITPPVALDNFI